MGLLYCERAIFTIKSLDLALIHRYNWRRCHETQQRSDTVGCGLRGRSGCHDGLHRQPGFPRGLERHPGGRRPARAEYDPLLRLRLGGRRGPSPALLRRPRGRHDLHRPAPLGPVRRDIRPARPFRHPLCGFAPAGHLPPSSAPTMRRPTGRWRRWRRTGCGHPMPSRSVGSTI